MGPDIPRGSVRYPMSHCRIDVTVSFTVASAAGLVL